MDKWQSVRSRLDNILNLGLELEAAACSVQSLARALELELTSIKTTTSVFQEHYNHDEDTEELVI